MTRYRDTYAKVRLDYIKENVETLYKKLKNLWWLSLKQMRMDMAIKKLLLF
jgi:alanine racemase (EC 5.1.1.1)